MKHNSQHTRSGAAVLIVCAMLFIASCATAPGAAENVWTPLTENDTLTGTWVGERIIPLSFAGIPDIDLPLKLTVKAPVQRDGVLYNLFSIYIDVSPLLEYAVTSEQRAAVWQEITGTIPESETDDGLIFLFDMSEGYPYTISATLLAVPQLYFKEAFGDFEAVYVNADRSQIKMVSRPEDEEKVFEIILHKQ